MKSSRPVAPVRWAAVLGLLSLFVCLATAQVNPAEYAGLVWRNIGPFRAGRVSAVSAPIGQPGVFYDGLPAGGVWKTESAGATWFPIFDSVKSVSSVGSIAVAPSDPNIIYVGTGDLVAQSAINEGDGVYKSTDAGKSWIHLGMEATKQIPAIIVDPKDPNIVLMAAQGDIHHPSEDRGVYRSTDGGRTWKRVLYKDNVTGAQDVEFAYDRPNVVFATTVLHQSVVVGRSSGPASGNGATGLYKSTDEGATWTQVTSSSLPSLTGRTSVAVAMNTNAQRVYLIGAFGLYRSNDGGATWAKTTTDYRIVSSGSGFICGVMVDPKNPDIVYVMNTSVYRSTDGGATFAAWKGAPGGDDYHAIWIDPTDPKRMSLASDEGATVSLDGGSVWSPWYNQPTAQTYHIAVNNEFPYWVYGTQQDPCAVAQRSRGDLGQTTPWDWTPLAIYENGNIAPDPLNPDIIYGQGGDSGILKVFRKSGQWENVAPNIGAGRGGPGTAFRKGTDQPLVFSPEDPHTLYLGTQYVTATSDGGVHWRNLGNQDLATRTLTPDEEAMATASGGRGGSGRASGALSSIAPSSKTASVIWTGSNNGLIYLTKDGGNTWKNVSPKGLPANANVVIMDASHSDPAEAYAAVDVHAVGDYTPYIYRTRNYGQNWDLIVNGLPKGEVSGSFVRVVREDTVKKGLLFACTESSVFVSFDDGDHWQSLRLNLPTVSYRDLIVHGNDVVVGTYGRSFWILDDISALRQITPDLASKTAYLFKPSDAIRVRHDVNRNTPLPPEVPHGLNPPEGAIIYYYLSSKPADDIKLQILDSANNVVRTLSSAPIPPVTINPPPNVPDYWFEVPMPMATEAGTNRVNWDLHYDRPPSFVQNYSMEKFDALFHATVYDPRGPLAIPGTYTAKLTVNGTTFSQSFKVLIDPRVSESKQATQSDLVAMHDLLMKVYKSMFVSWDGYKQVQAMRAQLKDLTSRQVPPPVADAATALDLKLGAIEGAPAAGRGGGGGAAAAGAGAGGRGAGGAAPQIGFGALNIQFGGDGQTGYINAFGTADIAPTPAERRAYQISCTSLNDAIARWNALKNEEVAAFNNLARQNNLTPPAIPTTALPTTACGPPVSIAPPAAIRARTQTH